MTYTALRSPEPLTLSLRVQSRLDHGELTPSQVQRFQSFLQEVEGQFLHHPIILRNAYTHWFSQGLATDEELRHFIRQFSVFSNQFLVAALQKVINSPTLDQSRASREILLNELGVIYRNPHPAKKAATVLSREDLRQDILSEEAKDHQGDPELVSTEGTVDGGTCRFRAAHFEWLLGVAAGVGLDYDDVGQRHHGRPTTLHFCDELIRLYGSDDASLAEGASFAVENWAAAGFWQELEDGLLKIKRDRLPSLKLAFFAWHNRVEAQHAGHTLEELESVYFQPAFNREKFLQGGREIMEAIAVFWNGLNDDRLRLGF